MTTQTFAPPVTVTPGESEPDTPLVVLLHGRGSDEHGIIGLAGALSAGAEYVAVRAPIAEGGGYAWFANRGIGRPIAESLDDTTTWFETWLAGHVSANRRVILIGFSGGAAFAGGLVLRHPQRYMGAAILYGTVPFDAGVPTTSDRLAGTHVFVAQGDADDVIPRELLDRTWTYLREESGGDVTSHRDPSGHVLSERAIEALSDWLEGVIDAARNGED